VALPDKGARRTGSCYIPTVSLESIKRKVEALVPTAQGVTVEVRPPGVLVVKVTAPGSPEDRRRLAERLTVVLARTLGHRFEVEVQAPGPTRLGGPEARATPGAPAPRGLGDEAPGRPPGRPGGGRRS